MIPVGYPPAMLTAGMLILAAAIVLARLLEGRWTAPSVLFFGAFFVHGYLDPLARAGTDQVLKLDNLAAILVFTTRAFGCLLLGYLLVQLALLRRRSGGASPGGVPMTPVLGRLGTVLAAGALALVLASMYGVLISTGALNTARGFMSYQGGVARQFTLLNTAVYSLVGALFIARWQATGRRRAALTAGIAAAVGLIAAHSLLQFGRMTIVSTMLILAVIYHARICPLRPRHALVYGLGGLAVTAVSLGRSLGVGILDLDLRMILDMGAEIGRDPGRYAGIAAMSVPGQAVFSRTMDLVPAMYDHQYGLTYLRSLASVFTPNVVSSSYDLATPAFWFRNAYAPGVVGHGFDFSMLAEAYLNFGRLGPLVFVGVGAILAGASRGILRSRSPLIMLWCVIILVDLIIGLRNDSNAVVKRMVFFMLPVLTVILIERLLARARMRTLWRGGPNAPPAGGD